MGERDSKFSLQASYVSVAISLLFICKLEIATSAYGLLAMTNDLEGRVDRQHIFPYTIYAYDKYYYPKHNAESEL